MLGELGLYPDIPEQGPRIGAALCLCIREDADYWDRRPEDHGVTGFFIGGPIEARPPWFAEVKTGDANRAPTHETREAALQRMDEDKNRKLRRMNLGVIGYFTGRNRRAA